MRRLLAAVMVVLGWWAVVWAGEFKRVVPGLELGWWEAHESVSAGGGRVVVVRIDPQRFRFKVLVAKGEGLSAGAWLERTGAVVVFNAGLHAPDGSYLGLVVSGGKVMGRMVKGMEGLFVAEPRVRGLPLARVIDLRYAGFDLQANPYQEVAQSLMLLDRFGQLRVRRSGRVANRTLVGEDRQGWIVVMVTEGAHGLWELAQELKGSGLGLREVMCMDGGRESQLELRVGGVHYSHYGKAGGQIQLPWPPAKLPVAIGVFPREEGD